MSLTFAQYVVQPFFPNCPIPDDAVRLIAALTICKSHFTKSNQSNRYPMYTNLSYHYKFLGLLTFINCYDVKETSMMQNVFMFAKVAALVIIIITGVTWLGLGKF